MTETQPRVITLTREESRRTTEEMVFSMPEPEFTKSHHPHSHKKVVLATEEAIKGAGLKIGKRTYSLTKNGANMHALWEVGRRDGKLNCVGFRNSLTKLLSIAYTSVLTVLICTNQITHANWFTLRRHTGGLKKEDLAVLAAEAIQQVVADFAITDHWHEALKEIKFVKRRVEQLTIKAMRAGVLAPSKFKEFDTLLFGSKDQDPVYSQTLYGFHGALTQMIRDHNLEMIPWENKRITEFVNLVNPKSTH